MLTDGGWLPDGTFRHLLAFDSSSEKLAQSVTTNRVSRRSTRTSQHHQQTLAANPAAARTANLGEVTIQETMNDFALDQPQKTGVFLFEDHRIARASFLLPVNCRKVSTRAFLLFLAQQGWLASAVEIERRAILAGRNFSRLRFSPEQSTAKRAKEAGFRVAPVVAAETNSPFNVESVPVSVLAAKVTKIGSQLVSVGGGLRYWADGPENGPEDLGYRLVVTLLFPQ